MPKIKLNDIKAAPNKKILVIGNNGSWAKAQTWKEAKRLAHNPKHYNVYEVGPDTMVSDYGSLMYPSQNPPRLIVKK